MNMAKKSKRIFSIKTFSILLILLVGMNQVNSEIIDISSMKNQMNVLINGNANT